MKSKLYKLLTAVALSCVLCLTFAPTAALAAGRSDSLIIVLEASEIVDNRVEIVARLARNSGVLSMKLTLNYDVGALTLVEVTDGEALADMIITHSGSLDYTPYGILYNCRYHENYYPKKDADDSLLTFVFEIKENAPNGKYKISLTTDKNGVEYLDEDDNLQYKNILTSAAEITITGEETTVVIPEIPNVDVGGNGDDTNSNTNILAILIPVAVAALFLVALTVVLVLLKSKHGKK